MTSRISERRLITLLAAVQFVNVLDFMMVMPLGPDFAAGLGIPSARLGLVSSAYTAAAAVTGLIGAFFLDRFDRRRALLVSLIGLAIGTLAAAFAQGLPSMLAARLVAGAFGGPATSLTYSIIADTVPPERRGRALGTVMGAFAIASVVGVPAGLFVAQLVSWHAPFVAVAVLISIIGVAVAVNLPPMRDHVASASAVAMFDFSFLTRALPLAPLALTGVTFGGMFLVIPFISPYLQFNLGFSRDYIGWLYMGGGAISFFTMRLAGWAVDRRGATPTAMFGTTLFAAALILGFAYEPSLVPVPVFFVLFMVSGSFRMVPTNTVATRIPGPAERARFMSVQSAVQHLATTAGAVTASSLLGERANKGLDNMPMVTWVALGLGSLLPFGLAVIEPWVGRIERERRQVAAPPVPRST